MLVDAADERLAGDHFPGVEVVRRIRGSQGDARPVVTVITGHFFNDGLRHRMAAAGADLFFLRSDLRSSAALCDVVLHPEHYRRGVPGLSDPGTADAMGITATSRLEELVDYVGRHGLEGAFDPENPWREDPRGRHWLRHRQGIAEAAGIESVNLTTGAAPYGNQAAPSLRQLRRIYGWAAKVQAGRQATAPPAAAREPPEHPLGDGRDPG